MKDIVVYDFIDIAQQYIVNGLVTLAKKWGDKKCNQAY